MPKANQKDLRREAYLAKQREYKRGKKQCPICQKYMRANHFPGHARRKHAEKLQELNIKPKVKVIGPPYSFIYRMVKRCIEQDKDEKTKDEKREITIQIMKKLGDRLEKSKNNEPIHDDCGGYLPTGFHFGSHSLYKLSLDRKDNDKIHFRLDGTSYINNIRFVIHGINHRTNPTAWGKDMCAIFRDRVNRKTKPEETAKLLERLKKTTCKGKNTLAYMSVWDAYRRDGKKYFSSFSEMYEYCIELLRKQNFICPVSKILMSDTLENSQPNRRRFAPSLNAKDARKGHRKENLEWIISCLNNGNCDKQKKEIYETDHPTTWNTKRFFEYIEIN
jgi:hypothetical protein